VPFQRRVSNPPISNPPISNPPISNPPISNPPSIALDRSRRTGPCLRP
jgi:hypothetical protein